MSQAAFADEAARVFRETHSGSTVTSSGDRLEAKLADGGSATVFLSNAYVRYRNQPQDLAAILQSAIAQPSMEGAFRGDILPVIRAKEWSQVVERQLRQAGASEDQIRQSVPATIAVADDLVLAFAQDSAGHVRMLSPADLKGLGINSLDEARAQSLDELRERLPDLNIDGRESRYRLRLDGVYESSMVLLLDAETWSKLGFRGDAVIAIPSRDQVLICDSADTESVAAMRAHARKMYDALDHAISSKLYKLVGGRLEEY